VARRRVAFGFLCAAGVILARCSLLVDFVDQTVDGGCEGCDASLPDVTVDSPSEPDSADVRDAGPPDVATLCKGKSNGWYCGFNGLNGTAPSKDDLVECEDASVYKLTLCDAGCLSYPNGVPDRCNECPGMKDGYYCGSQFPSARPENGHVLVLCTAGQGIVEQDCLPGTCAPGPGTAKCQ
jgi:hypothetical protein